MRFVTIIVSILISIVDNGTFTWSQKFIIKDIFYSTVSIGPLTECPEAPKKFVTVEKYEHS